MTFHTDIAQRLAYHSRWGCFGTPNLKDDRIAQALLELVRKEAPFFQAVHYTPGDYWYDFSYPTFVEGTFKYPGVLYALALLKLWGEEK